MIKWFRDWVNTLNGPITHEVYKQDKQTGRMLYVKSLRLSTFDSKEVWQIRAVYRELGYYVKAVTA